MRILFVTQSPPCPPTTASQLKVFDIIRTLSGKHEMHLISFRGPQEPIDTNQLEALGCKVWGVFESIIPRPLILHALRNVFEPWPLSLRRYNHPDVGKLIREVIQTQGIELVHLDMINMAVFAPDVSTCASVLAPNDCTALFMERSIERSAGLRRHYVRLQAQKWRYFESKELARFTTCWMVSDTDKQALLDLNKNLNVEMIPLPVDTSFFAPDAAPDAAEEALVYMGAMDSERNVEALAFFLQEIWPLVIAQRPDVGLYVVGKNPGADVYALCENDSRIEVTGTVDDVRPYLTQNRVHVCPITYGSGMKIRLLQAMAMGQSVVSTSVGVENLGVLPEEHLLLADQPQAFADAVVTLLNDPKRRAYMGNVARQFVVNHYGAQAVVDRVETMYKEAIERFAQASEQAPN